MTFHDFEGLGSHVSLTWANVFPGDMVRCPGVAAYRLRDWTTRSEETRVLRLAQRPLLVIARKEGCDGDPSLRTFVVLSRHGILVLTRTRRGW